MARPSKLTPDLEKTIMDALRAGATRTAAALAAGATLRSFERWMKRAAFAGQIVQAEAEAELRATITIRTAINDGHWEAAAWWLERRRHDDWGRHDRMDLIATVRELAREHGLSVDEERAAVAEAVRYLREHQRGGR
jgi:hypothetical protein